MYLFLFLRFFLAFRFFFFFHRFVIKKTAIANETQPAILPTIAVTTTSTFPPLDSLESSCSFGTSNITRDIKGKEVQIY